MSRLTELKTEYAALIEEVERLNDDYNAKRVLKTPTAYLEVTRIIDEMRAKNKRIDKLAKLIDQEQKKASDATQSKLF